MSVQFGGDRGEVEKQREPARGPAHHRRAQRDGHREGGSGQEAGGRFTVVRFPQHCPFVCLTVDGHRCKQEEKVAEDCVVLSSLHLEIRKKHKADVDFLPSCQWWVKRSQ